VVVSLVERLRNSGSSALGPGLTFDEHMVSAIRGGEPDVGTSQERYSLWRASQNGALPTEYLLPRIVRDVECAWPSFMRRSRPGLAVDALRSKLADLGPWYVPFALGDPVVNTMEFTDNFGAAIFADDNALRMQFRTELIGGTLSRVLGDELRQMNVLDIGCNSGWFSFDFAQRGARSVDGFDLRAHNIDQARFLRDYFQLETTRFEVADALSFDDDRRWDIVLNLGVLYHVTDPLRLLQRTYERCERFAVVDTICHQEPFSGFVLFDTKDASHPHEGRESWEFHPTYRGEIDALRYAGFSEVIEIVASDSTARGLYRGGGRRCFLAVK
jgi:SAM-dependent methyltransferase